MGSLNRRRGGRAVGTGRSAPGSDAGGLTIIELVIVLVIAALTLGWAGLTFGGFFQRSSARRAAQVFARDLTLARSSAMRGREPVVIRFYETGRWYVVVLEESGAEVVRRRFGTDADVALSAIDLRMKGDSLVFTPKGFADLTDKDDSGPLGEAWFSAGAAEFSVRFNSMGASQVEER